MNSVLEDRPDYSSTVVGVRAALQSLTQALLAAHGLSSHYASRAHFLRTFSSEPVGRPAPCLGLPIPLPEVGVGEWCFLHHSRNLLDGGRASIMQSPRCGVPNYLIAIIESYGLHQHYCREQFKAVNGKLYLHRDICFLSPSWPMVSTFLGAGGGAGWEGN